jgi:hypothetical protein
VPIAVAGVVALPVPTRVLGDGERVGRGRDVAVKGMDTGVNMGVPREPNSMPG